MTSDQPPNCELAVRSSQNLNDAFTITLSNRLRLFDEKDVSKTANEDRSIGTLYVINSASPPQEIETDDDYLLKYNGNLDGLNQIDLILHAKDINENAIIQHAQEFDELVEFECAKEITADDLFIQEVLEDVITRAFEYSENTRNHLTNGITDEEDDDYCKLARVRRCSSLKSGKTPPGTPSCKKIVRFADVLGLDLADVRTYLDEIPKVPLSAYKDLSNCDIGDVYHHTCQSQTHPVNVRTLLALFQQPVSNPNFISMVTLRMVSLENAYVADPISFCIKGVIRVRNLDFNKSVHVRFTMDAWKSYTDVPAVYADGSSDGFTDRFTFTLYAYSLEFGGKLEFAVRYQCRGEQYWDNNGGINYVFQCLPAATPPPPSIPLELNEQFATFCYAHGENALMPANATVHDEDDEYKQEMLCDSKKKIMELNSMEVQEYIARSLDKNLTKSQHVNPKPELLIVIAVVLASIIVMYVKKVFF